MPAARAAGKWGEYFQLIASVYDNVFASNFYRDVFFAWSKRFYESAEKGDPTPGQALALVGPIHCYKSSISSQAETDWQTSKRSPTGSGNSGISLRRIASSAYRPATIQDKRLQVAAIFRAKQGRLDQLELRV